MWGWDWTQPFSWPGLIWGIVTSVILPASAIIFAVRIGQRQSQATLDAQLGVLQAEAERDERRAELAKDARIDRAFEEMLTALGGIQRAVFRTNLEAVDIRLASAHSLPIIAGYLGPDLDPVTEWVVLELAIMGHGLEGPRDARGFPAHGEHIQQRAGHFINAVTDWRLGKTDVEWFRDRKHLRLEDTPPVKAFDETVYADRVVGKSEGATGS